MGRERAGAVRPTDSPLPLQIQAPGDADRHIVHSRGIKMWQLRAAGSLEGTCAQYPPAEEGRWPLGAQYPPAEGIFFSLS
jgi:hypothetical protein